jgi:mono/diheme cytochrome c family protein
MKTLKRINVPAILGIFLLTLFLTAFVLPQDKKKGGPWTIPDKYKTMKNPYAGQKDLVNVGKLLYAKNCKSCHGTTGKGDGPRAAGLTTHPGDFSNATWQKDNTDGDLYYMAIMGRDEMPNFEKKITDEQDRWALIMYIRTL